MADATRCVLSMHAWCSDLVCSGGPSLSSVIEPLVQHIVAALARLTSPSAAVSPVAKKRRLVLPPPLFESAEVPESHVEDTSLSPHDNRPVSVFASAITTPIAAAAAAAATATATATATALQMPSFRSRSRSGSGSSQSPVPPSPSPQLPSPSGSIDGVPLGLWGSARAMPLDRVHAPPCMVFASSILGHRPVILTGTIADWPACQRWSDPAYLKAVAGHRTVPIELGAYQSEGFGFCLQTLADFIDGPLQSGEAAGVGTATTDTDGEDHRAHQRSGGDSKPYLAQHPLFDQVPALRQDIRVPDYCYLPTLSHTGDRYDGQEEDDAADVQINAWLGPAGTVSCLHWDPAHVRVSHSFPRAMFVHCAHARVCVCVCVCVH
jgi:hypothetical protein